MSGLEDLLRRHQVAWRAMTPWRTAAPRWATQAPSEPVGDSLSLRLYGSGLQAGQRPVLVVTPQVNHSCIADLAPDQSLVRTLLGAGLGRVAVTDWGPPPDRAYGIADSIDDLLACIDRLDGPVHLVGLCQGGWQVAIVAALYPRRVASLTVAAAPIDTHAGGTLLHLFSLGLPLGFFRGVVAAGGGRAPGWMLAQGFDQLKPFERLVYHPWSVFWRAEDPDYLRRFGTLRGWYRFNKDVAGQLYLEAIDQLFQRNLLFKGELQLAGRRVGLGDIQCPVSLVAGRRDHITPQEQVWALEQHLRPGQASRWLVDAGHVGVFAGRRALADTWPKIAAAWPSGPENASDGCPARARR